MPSTSPTPKLVWQVPVGTAQDTRLMGIKIRLRLPVGMPTLGPTPATQAGLPFIADPQDCYLRASTSPAARRSGARACRWAAGRAR